MTNEEKRLARNAQARDYYHNWGGNATYKKYYWTHCEECIARSKAYYQTHREQRKAYRKQYDSIHRDEINARRRKNYNLKQKLYQKAYREVPEHREKMLEYQRNYRARKKAEKLRKESELS